MHYCKEIPVRYHADVFIAGGGPSGVAAAVTCAQLGKSVFLAEARGCFGGMGTAGLVPEIMPFTDGSHFLAQGFGKRVFDALFPGQSRQRRARSIRVENVKRLYDRLMAEAGVQFSFFTQLVDVLTDGSGTVTAAILSAKSGLFAVEADIFIDCTGDGDLCALAGADFDMGDENGICMAATLCSLWGGADFSRVAGPDDRALEEAFAQGVFTQQDRHLPGMRQIPGMPGIAGGNVGHCFAVDATDETSLTRAMLQGRRLLPEYEHYYKNYLTGYENLQLLASAEVMGIRESRRIQGEYRLCYEDYVNCAVFPDEIGRYNYPVDIHVRNTDPEEYRRFEVQLRDYHLPDGASYGIPYRCLIPKKLTNVLMAGRCISTDRAVQASIRVIPGCFITGQAAGAAAALARGNVRDVDIAQLRNTLASLSGEAGRTEYV